MYSSHREAFQQKANSKKPIESNLDSIINQAQLKMKEMINENQNLHKQRNLLIGQEKVMDENINSLKNEINDKNEEINEKTKQLSEIEENIKNLENEKKEEIRKANVKEAKLKDDINNINEELERIKHGTIPAQASKTFELKKSCEEVEELKKKNNQLRERLYLLSRRLYSLEVRNIFLLIYIQNENERSRKDEEISANKARTGIENIEQFYEEAKKKFGEQEEENEEDEEDNDKVRSDNENEIEINKAEEEKIEENNVEHKNNENSGE